MLFLVPRQQENSDKGRTLMSPLTLVLAFFFYKLLGIRMGFCYAAANATITNEVRVHLLWAGSGAEQNDGGHEERARLCTAQENRRALGRSQAGQPVRSVGLSVGRIFHVLPI